MKIVSTTLLLTNFLDFGLRASLSDTPDEPGAPDTDDTLDVLDTPRAFDTPNVLDWITGKNFFKSLRF